MECRRSPLMYNFNEILLGFLLDSTLFQTLYTISIRYCRYHSDCMFKLRRTILHGPFIRGISFYASILVIYRYLLPILLFHYKAVWKKGCIIRGIFCIYYFQCRFVWFDLINYITYDDTIFVVEIACAGAPNFGGLLTFRFLAGVFASGKCRITEFILQNYVSVDAYILILYYLGPLTNAGSCVGDMVRRNSNIKIICSSHQ